MSDSEQTPPLTAPAHVAGIDREAFRRAVDDEFETVIDQLTELVAIPGIAWDSFDQEPLERSAKAVAALIEAEGFDSVEIHAADGSESHPAILARREAAEGRPTVLLLSLIHI